MPRDFQIFAHRLERAQKFSLLDGERADGEIDGSALLQQQQRFQHGQRILAAGQRHGHAIAVANHLESRDGLADLAQECFFEVHSVFVSVRTWRTLAAVCPHRADRFVQEIAETTLGLQACSPRHVYCFDNRI